MLDTGALSRKDVIVAALASLAAIGASQNASAQGSVAEREATVEELKAIERMFGFELSDAEREAIRGELRGDMAAVKWVHEQKITFTTDPSTLFTPYGDKPKAGKVQAKVNMPKVARPKSEVDLAFASLPTLAAMLRSRQVTSTELTNLYLGRLKKFGGRLQAVVTLTEDLALEQAAEADAEIKAGRYRGPLHGIPYGIKDLFATKDIPTTWGADPYKDQVFDFDATVVERLREAGAVLLGKLTLGALAMGDVWFGGTTKNPWNEAQGSSGSSAGSAACVSAGLVAFAVGTETYGSITSPSLRCRVTGHRPTYGRISRYGAMELSYTMDKAGPICRSAEDCGLVFAAICGSDGKDRSVVDSAFEFPRKLDFSKLKVGYVGSDAALKDDLLVKWFQVKGAHVSQATFTPMSDNLIAILDVECASAFDDLTRSGKLRELKNSTWPQTFRAARYIPAVDYLQLHRARTLAVEKFHQEWKDYDVLLMNGLGGTITHTNMGGHPQVMMPWGDDGKGNSLGKSLVGRLYQDDLLLTIAAEVQKEFDYSRRRPPAFSA